MHKGQADIGQEIEQQILWDLLVLVISTVITVDLGKTAQEKSRRLQATLSSSG